jgi:hypothetical protein
MRGGPQGGGGLLGNLLFGRQGIMGTFPQPIQDKGVIGSLIASLGSPGVQPTARPPMLRGAPPQQMAQDNLSAADYDKTPTTPADWTGTRADYIQDYKQDNPQLLGQLFGAGLPA